MVRLQFHLALASIISAIAVFHVVSGAIIPEPVPSTIQMVIALFRHGDRAPTSLYPKDPHINHEWPGGLGSLSQKGALQHYNLGQKLRARYHHLIPKDGQYTKDVIYVQSSDVERCLMSAQSLLAGFLPPLKSKNLLPIDWQPVAVNTIPRNMDTLLAQKKPCKKYDEILKNLYKNPPEDLKKMNEENKDLYRLLTKHTGENVTKSSDIAFLYKTLLIEKDAGLTLPDWTENIFPERMVQFREREFALLTETPYMKKVKGGAIITEVLNTMNNRKNNALTPNRNIFLYLAHDTTIANALNSLDIVKQTTTLPDYASALIFELHKNIALDNDLEIKLFYYQNSEVNSPKEVDIPKCKRPCSLTQFGDSVKYLLYDNFDEICENVKSINLSC